MPTPITLRRAIGAALLIAGLSACTPATAVPPTVVPPTIAPATAVPPTAAPPTAAPPTIAPATAVPPTVVPTVAPAQPIIPVSVARATVQSFLEAYFAGGDAYVYLGGEVGAEVAAGRPLHQYMGEGPGYRGFAVHDAEALPGGNASVNADITYGDTTVEQRYELAVTLGEWIIVGIEVAGTRPAEQAPGDGAAWQSALTGDLNGDGTTEQVSYRPAQLQLPPTGFSDPSIVALLIASEMSVRQEASPGGRELLSLNQGALTAEGAPLASFDGQGPAGFLVIVYGGERHTFRVAPLGADGYPIGNQAYEIAWSDQEGGYRVR